MFEQFIGIDWSGAEKPVKTNAIALASCSVSSLLAPVAIHSKLSRDDVFQYICELMRSRQKVLVGIDCNLGYARSVADETFGNDINYSELWRQVENLNIDNKNLFAGNVWKNPRYQDCFWTKGKQPDWFNLDKLRRITEKAAIEQSLGTPESPFKLIGAKQVGKGGLSGMRLVHQLKTQFGDQVAVWPFEPTLLNNARVVISEIYPRLFIKYADKGNLKVRDHDSLNFVLSKLDAKAYKRESALSDHLTDAIISSAGLRHFIKKGYSLSSELPAAAVDIEGWIFGVDSVVAQ
jgi:hypothetical protein